MRKLTVISLLTMLCVTVIISGQGFADIEYKRFNQDKDRFERHIESADVSASDLKEWDEIMMHARQAMIADWEKDAQQKMAEELGRSGDDSADQAELLRLKEAALADWERDFDQAMAVEKGAWLARTNIVYGNFDRETILAILGDARQLDISLDTFSQWDDYISPRIDAVSAAWEQNLQDVINAINSNGLDETAQTAFRAEVLKIEKDLRSQFSLDRNTLVYLERNQRITDLLLHSQPGYGKEGNLDELLDSVIKDTERNLQNIDSALNEKLKTPDALTADDFATVNNDTWNQDIMNIINQGLAKWEEAQRQLYEKMYAWQNDAYNSFDENNNKWEAAYDRLVVARQAWIDNWDAQVATAAAAWNAKLTELSGNIDGLNETMGGYYSAQYGKWQEYSSGLYSMVASLPGLVATAQDNIAWFNSHKTSFTDYLGPMAIFVFWDPVNGIGTQNQVPQPEENRCMITSAQGYCIKYETGYWYNGNWTYVSGSDLIDPVYGIWQDYYDPQAQARLQNQWKLDIIASMNKTIGERCATNDILKQLYDSHYFYKWIENDSSNNLTIVHNPLGMDTFSTNAVVLLSTAGIDEPVIYNPTSPDDTYRMDIGFSINEDYPGDNNDITYVDSFTYVAPAKYTLFYYQSQDWSALLPQLQDLKNSADSDLLSSNGANAGYLRNSSGNYGLEYDAQGNLSTDSYLMTGTERSYELLRRELDYREKRLAIADELRKWAYPGQFPADNPYVVNGERVSVATLESWMNSAHGQKETARTLYENALAAAKEYYSNETREYQTALKSYNNYLTDKKGLAETLNNTKTAYLAAVKALIDAQTANPAGSHDALRAEVVSTRDAYLFAQGEYNVIKNNTTTKTALDNAYNAYIGLMNTAQSLYKDFQDAEFSYEKAYSVWEYANTPYLSELDNYDDSLLQAYVYSQGYNEETALGMYAPDANRYYADMLEHYNQAQGAFLVSQSLKQQEDSQYNTFSALQGDAYKGIKNALSVNLAAIVNEAAVMEGMGAAIDPVELKNRMAQQVNGYLAASPAVNPAGGSVELLLREQRGALQLMIDQFITSGYIPDVSQIGTALRSVIDESVAGIDNQLANLAIDRPAGSYTLAELYSNDDYLEKRNRAEMVISKLSVGGIASMVQMNNDDTINAILNGELKTALDELRASSNAIMYDGNGRINAASATAVIRDREALFKNLLAPLANIDGFAKGGIALFGAVLQELLGSGGAYNDAILALIDQAGSFNGQSGDLVINKALERANRWSEVTSYVKARGTLDWDLGLADFGKKWEEWRGQAITKIRNGEVAWQDKAIEFHTSANEWKQDAARLSGQVGSREAKEKLTAMYNGIDQSIDSISKGLPFGITININTDELYQKTLLLMPQFDLGVLKDTMQSIDTTAGFTELLNLNLDFGTYNAFQKAMEEFSNKSVKTQTLRVGEMVEDTYKQFLKILQDVNQQARDQVDKEIVKNEDLSKAPFEKKNRSWQLETIRDKSASGTIHETIVFDDFRDYINQTVFIQNGTTIDGIEIDFKDPNTYLSIDPNEMMIYADLEARRMQTEIDKVFNGDESLFNLYAQDEGSRVMTKAGDAYVKYISGKALDDKVEKNRFNNIAYRSVFEGGPNVFTVTKVVATVVATAYGGGIGGVAVAAAFTAMEVASGNIEWQHALVQFAIEAAASYCGGSGLSGAVAGMAIRTAASGIEYKDGGSIAWNKDKLTSGIKSNIVQFALQQGVKALVGQAAGDATGELLTQTIGSAVTGVVMSGLDTSGDWKHFGYDTENMGQHLATGLGAGLSTLASGFLTPYTGGQSDNPAIDKLITGTITGAVNQLAGITDEFNWDGLTMNAADIGGYAGKQLSQSLVNAEDRERNEGKEGSKDATDPLGQAEEWLGGLLLSLKRGFNSVLGTGDESASEQDFQAREDKLDMLKELYAETAVNAHLAKEFNIYNMNDAMTGAGGGYRTDIERNQNMGTLLTNINNELANQGIDMQFSSPLEIQEAVKSGELPVELVQLAATQNMNQSQVQNFQNIYGIATGLGNGSVQQVGGTYYSGVSVVGYQQAYETKVCGYSQDAVDPNSTAGMLDPENSLTIDPNAIGIYANQKGGSLIWNVLASAGAGDNPFGNALHTIGPDMPEGGHQVLAGSIGVGALLSLGGSGILAAAPSIGVWATGTAAPALGAAGMWAGTQGQRIGQGVMNWATETAGPALQNGFYQTTNFLLTSPVARDAAFAGGTGATSYLMNTPQSQWNLVDFGITTGTHMLTGGILSPMSGQTAYGYYMNDASRFGAGFLGGVAVDSLNQLYIGGIENYNLPSALWSGLMYGTGTMFAGNLNDGRISAGQSYSYWETSGLANGTRIIPSIAGSWGIGQVNQFYFFKDSTKDKEIIK